MPFLSKTRIRLITPVLTGALLSAFAAWAAMDPRFELDPTSLSGASKPAKTQGDSVKRVARARSSRAAASADKGDLYTVKSGDNLFKILMRDYGLSDAEADSFIEEIKRENNIYDIKRLKIGQKITIPKVKRRADGTLKLAQVAAVDAVRGTSPEQSFKLESPVAPLSEQEVVVRTQDVWNQIVPAKKEQQKPLSIQTSTFSLTLDPQRYPTFARMDGGRLILDQNGSIPPLVKSLIEEKETSVRIVAEAPASSKKFMASLLESGGFYSIEENFVMDFGVDPKITVQADFKVEKSADSLMKQDVVLVNSGRTSLPPTLGAFLKKEGFSLYEPFASVKPFAQRDSRTIHQVAAKNQAELIDSILTAFAVTPERDKRVDVFAADNNGISLAVKAERFFERGGQRYVVTNFDGDPINYTLFRILETKGYKVVILEAQDDFRKISEKLIARMKLKGNYALHDMLQDSAAGFTLQMSGFKIDDSQMPGGGIFLTDRPMDRIIKDLFTENGYNMNAR